MLVYNQFPWLCLYGIFSNSSRLVYRAITIVRGIEHGHGKATRWSRRDAAETPTNSASLGASRSIQVFRSYILPHTILRCWGFIKYLDSFFFEILPWIFFSSVLKWKKSEYFFNEIYIWMLFYFFLYFL